MIDHFIKVIPEAKRRKAAPGSAIISTNSGHVKRRRLKSCSSIWIITRDTYSPDFAVTHEPSGLAAAVKLSHRQAELLSRIYSTMLPYAESREQAAAFYAMPGNVQAWMVSFAEGAVLAPEARR
jgi:hypothetical protein